METRTLPSKFPRSLQQPTAEVASISSTAMTPGDDAAACHPHHSRDITDAVISSVPATNPPPASEPSQASSSTSTSETRLIVQPLGPDLPPFQAEPYKIATLRMQFFWFLIVRRVHELFLHNTKLLLLGRADLQRTLNLEKGRQDDISEVFDFWLKRKRMWELTKTVTQSKKGWVWREKRDQMTDTEEKVIELSSRASETRFQDLAKGRQAGEWVPGGADNTGEVLWHDSRKGSCTWDGDCECVFTPGGIDLRGPWAWRGSEWGRPAWGDLVMWLVGLCRAHLIPDVDNRSPNRGIPNSEDVEALDDHDHVTTAREGTQSSNPDVTLKPDLSNLDWTTFCYLFPHTFSDTSALHMRPGNPNMNPGVIRPGLGGVPPSIPRHPWLEVRMFRRSNPMDLDNWRHIPLQQPGSIVRSFEEARKMAWEVCSKHDIDLPTGLERGIKHDAELQQNVDCYKERQEPLAVDEFYPFPTRLERSFWRFGIGPAPRFPIGPPPAPGAPEIPQLPPARKVAAYGSLMLHVNSFQLSADLLWWDAMAAEHVRAKGKKPIGPLGPLELIDPKGRLAHGLVVRSLWAYVLERLSKREYMIEYIQRVRRRAERGLGGVDVDRNEDDDVGEIGDWNESLEGQEEAENKEKEEEVASLGKTLQRDAFWDAFDGLEEFRRRWGIQELAFWLRRIEERIFLLLSSFPRGVGKEKGVASGNACGIGEADIPPDEGGLWKFHVPQEEDDVASGSRRGVAKDFVDLVLREFPELAWEGLPSWYGRSDLIRLNVL